MIQTANKRWVLCSCPECQNGFIVKLESHGNAFNPNDLFGLRPLPENLTCPYCGIKNDVYAEAFPNVRI